MFYKRKSKGFSKALLEPRGEALSVRESKSELLSSLGRTTLGYSPSSVDEEKKEPYESLSSKDLLKTAVMNRQLFKLMSGHKKFPVVIHAQSTLSADGSGILRGFIPFDPVLLSSGDYTSFATLFDQVRLLEAEVCFVPVLNADHANTASGSSVVQAVRAIMAGVDRNAINTTTTSYLEVLRLDGAQMLTRTTAETGGVTIIRYRNIARPPCSTAVPSTIDPPAGCVGMVRYASAATLTASAVYFDIVIKLKLEFSNRV